MTSSLAVYYIYILF